MSQSSDSLSLVLIGCGAISELYYAPAIAEASKHIPIKVIGLCDPSPARLDILHSFFPDATRSSSLDSLLSLKPTLAIVASPPRFHAHQVETLLQAGTNVLCEKPLSCSVAEAESMVATAHRLNRLLCVGLFRRFFPALQVLHALVESHDLGPIKSFSFCEGGPFNWPAASPSFFQKSHSQGGVLLDLGAHILDLMCWWFGEPDTIIYEDDAMGNLEANCNLQIRYGNRITGQIRISRDTPTTNRYDFQFENGHVSWNVGDANHLNISFSHSSLVLASALQANNMPADSYHQSFVRQILNFASASQGHEIPLVPAYQVLPSMRLIEQCYASRSLLNMNWLTANEFESAKTLNRIP
jgi:predicted dehydrogenase